MQNTFMPLLACVICWPIWASYVPISQLAEFDINQRPLDIAEVLLALKPKIIGFGVYIWNVAETTKVVAAIKRVQPSIQIVLGGPEGKLTRPTSRNSSALADYVITGEADLKFAEVCRQLLSGTQPEMKILPARLPEFSQLVLPYDLYDDRTWRIVSSMWRPRAAAPSRANSVFHHSDIPVRQSPCPTC
jgi:radical SAM superfamily enzyme YgiQ (UPF0313 family)